MEIYLDAGPVAEPLASTIVDLTQERPLVRRIGAVSRDELRELLPDVADPSSALD